VRGSAEETVTRLTLRTFAGLVDMEQLQKGPPPNGKKLFSSPNYLAEHNRKTLMWDVEPDSASVVRRTTEEVRADGCTFVTVSQFLE
jgi:hypothetical protein